MDDYSISSISSDSAPRPINDRPTVPLIPLTMGQYYRHYFNKPPTVERFYQIIFAALLEYPIIKPNNSSIVTIRVSGWVIISNVVCRSVSVSVQLQLLSC